MKRIATILLAFMAVLMCRTAYADGPLPAETPAVNLLQQSELIKGAKLVKLEGLMLRMARPYMKKEPISAVMDDIETMYMLNLKDVSEADMAKFNAELSKAVQPYTKAGEVFREDTNSNLALYLDKPEGGVFHEMFLVVTNPDTVIMVFHGKFTEEGLLNMSALSQKRSKRKSKN